ARVPSATGHLGHPGRRRCLRRGDRLEPCGLALSGSGLFRRCTARRDAVVRADLVLDVERHLGVLPEELARVVLALPDAIAVVAVPGAALLDDVAGRAQIEDLALSRRALAVQDVELRGLERRRDLVLDDLDPGLAADDLVAFLDRPGAPDVEPHGRIELQRIAAR